MNADVKGANPKAADFTSADFMGAINGGTNFDGVIGIYTRSDGRKSTDS